MRQDKRTALINAGMELIAHKGFHGSPTALIAKKAKVATGSLFLYFQTKEDLIYEIHQVIQAKLTDMVADLDEEDAPFRVRFINIFSGLYRFLIANETEFRFLVQFYNSPYDVNLRYKKTRTEKSIIDSKRNAFEKLFEQGKKQHIIKKLPFQMLMGLAFGPMEFVIRAHYAGLIEIDDVNLKGYIDSCWDALKR